MTEEHYTNVMRTDAVTLTSCCLFTDSQPREEQAFHLTQFPPQVRL